MSTLPASQSKLANVAQEKGSSNWLTALPVERLGFALNKGQFRDAICLRYGWQMRFTPQTCHCGQGFDVDHVLSCRTGGFLSLRHNQLRDVIAELLREVCNDVSVEPRLQPLNGECLPSAANKEDEARLDVRAKGFWNNQQDAFFDVRVFYPFASSYRDSRLASVYRQHEQRKRLEYGKRVRDIERASFTPLVFTTSGGMASEATVFFKRLASMLAEKRGENYSETMGFVRCAVSFCLLRAVLSCIRSSYSSVKVQLKEQSVSDAVAVSRITGRV